MKKNSSVRLLWTFSAGVRGCFVLAVVSMAFSVLFSYLTPQIIRLTVDSVIGTEAMALPAWLLSIVESVGGREYLLRNLALCGLAIGVCALLSGVASYLARVNIAKSSEGYVRSMRDTLFTHIQHLPFEWHGKNQTGDIIQRCTSDVDQVRNFISAQLPDAVRTVILIAAAMWLMFSMNVTLAIICTAFIPVIILYSALFHTRIARQFRKADEAEGELTVAVQENLTGVRVVRAFGRERWELDRFTRCVDAFTDRWVDMGYTLGLFWGVGDFVSCLQLLTVVCVGAYLAATGSITLGALLAFILYTQTMAWPIRSLGRVLSELSKANVSLDRLRDILDAEVEPPEPDAVRPDLRADIEFKHVSFSYGEQEVLHDLSFKVEAGSTLGILGATGSGKSTVTYLLNRLYELPPENGSITIGGVDIRDIDRGYLRRGMGLVLQEPFLFSKTVGENIGIAAEGRDLSDLRRSARVAAVDADIEDFREGYDTVVGERGVTLSGGQKQRIAIARTLAMGCPVMIFDDSMSAVDMETDAKIRESLRENTSGATMILISHRINTLMRADKILVLEDGRLSESGTHAELARGGGVYSRVYRMQSDAGLVEGGDENG